MSIRETTVRTTSVFNGQFAFHGSPIHQRFHSQLDHPTGSRL
ncbi:MULTISPECIES: hypothetical protein [Shewanella]|nr:MULTISPECIES: hypothetical protein [Shewanella]